MSPGPPPTTPPASLPEYGRNLPVTPFRGYLLALAVLIGALVSVILFWRNAHERELRAAEADFVAETRQIAELLRQRMMSYELALGSSASLFTSVRPTPQQWQSFVDGLEIEQRFPGMLGMGYAPYVTPEGLRQLQLESLDGGQELLQLQPPGIRPYYGLVLYLAPTTLENRGVIGFDMFADPVRHAAMAAARDSGRPHLSGPVHLLQDRYGAGPQTGLLLYSPLYNPGEPVSTLEERRQSMRGWVYMPFHMSSFVEAALPPRDRYGGIDFRLYDVTGSVPELLHAEADRNPGKTPAFISSLPIDVYGRRWRMDFRSGPAEVASPGLAGLRVTLAIGLLSSLLLFGLVMLLARTENRARQIATQLTEDYRRSEQRFRMAMVYSAIGKALLDHEGRVVEANPALGSIVGRDPVQLAGEVFSSLFDDASDPVRTSEMEAVADGVFRTTRRLRRDSGELRYAQLTYAPIPGNVGQDIARLVQVEDVSDRLRAEAQVRALNRTLESRVAQRTRELSLANNELESFAYSVSHDLRAPLRSIEGFSRLLTERYQQVLDESGRDYLSRVRNATARMGELIEAMLKMARLSRSELKPRSLDLSQLAAEVIAELRAAEPARKVEVDIEPGMHAVGDPTLLRNLLVNLLGNAWKFTGESARPRIEFFRERRPSASPTYVVRDNGAGFETNYADKLFRPFQRLHSQEQFSGHGVGLASVKRIVERHGGSIQAEGTPGQGATFRFTLSGDWELGASPRS
ncbi:CHASE domain-containing protein [Luteimonas cucumeris]|nr:CHASE domain-containing protein [Luteimonas cucumeris]